MSKQDLESFAKEIEPLYEQLHEHNNRNLFLRTLVPGYSKEGIRIVEKIGEVYIKWGVEIPDYARLHTSDYIIAFSNELVRLVVYGYILLYAIEQFK
ncbi:hypothetical protein HYV50_00280 [Candidatus Pacearchaeota archaeon]|nr:hypothetical protein [Candidatus Pacearchaeota archaeon]